MPSRTNTDLIRDVQTAVVAIEQTLEHLKAEKADQAARLKEVEWQLAESQKENAELKTAVALATQRLDDHLKRVETWDSRRWGLVIAVLLAIFGSALSFAGGLALAQIRKTPS